ncbi:GSCOCG00011925001-RA-CDS [Cotesia congregata]|nr:GSCOCG00011925001-RA-CDS [Cotesia congregata]
MNIIKYGNIARKYDAFPALFTPLKRTKKIMAQVVRRHNTNRHEGCCNDISQEKMFCATL